MEEVKNIIEEEKICKKNNTSDNKLLYIIWLVMIIGIICGVMYIYFSENLPIVENWMTENLNRKSSGNLMNIFYSDGYSLLIYILSLFLLGFSPISLLIISLIPFLKGLNIGFGISYFYTHFGWQGLLYESFVDVPIIILVMMIISFSTKEAVKFSDNIYKIIKHKKLNNISVSQYIIKFVIIFIIAIIICLIDSVANIMFFRFFSL